MTGKADVETGLGFRAQTPYPYCLPVEIVADSQTIKQPFLG